MSINDNASLDTSRMGGGGGGGGRGPVIAGGGGIVGVIVVIVMVLLGFDPTGGGGGGAPQDTAGAGGDSWVQDNCKTGADAKKERRCLMVLGENSLQDFWSDQPDLAKALDDAGQQFRGPAQTVVYTGQTQSQCGTASNQVGPFYCPLDEKIFIDTDFFDIMEQQLGAQDGTLAELYVLAHEYGHHIQNVYGILDRAQQDPKGADSGAVRVELMADCFAGMWMKHATETKDANGEVLITDISESDIKNAMGAAKSVGDDEIQKKSGGGVNPESWTHGSAKARQAWLLRGMKTDSVNTCDTFEVSDPNNI
ncbi:neutral zinc metallopeptidase [Helicobacter pylori]|uniref:KPN_02809 family neutral zinc metallopeptidase n=1 Tax=unclassified Janibacter TaxID=2649294 RepID=UPI0020CBEB65|nr:neutral zinc metallopeptidase [Janibacter sp. CX7]UTT64740.1 neutral zinc metallopeptidase [Janibacter sp. CX7]